MQIPLTQGYFAEVDEGDYEELSKHRWHYKSGYAARAVGSSGERTRIWMQNEILAVDRGVDHIDRNGLNNRRSNLRIATKSLQGHNRLMPERQFPRGVSLHHGRYQASIRVNHELLYLGRYDTAEEASRVYRQKAFEIHGEYPPER